MIYANKSFVLDLYPIQFDHMATIIFMVTDFNVYTERPRTFFHDHSRKNFGALRTDVEFPFTDQVILSYIWHYPLRDKCYVALAHAGSG